MAGVFAWVSGGSLAYWKVKASEQQGFKALFFTRQGGYSQGNWQGLNLGLNTHDNQADVVRNRQLAGEAAGLGPWLPVLGQQTHSATVRHVDEEASGRGWLSWDTGLAETDALFTSVRGLPLAVTTADCLPVLLAEPNGRAVAAVHAGWRGLAGSILSQTVKKMQSELNLQPSRLCAYLGPAIGPESFVIRGDVLQRLQDLYPEAVTDPQHDGSAGFNLWQAARSQLQQSGVNPLQIHCLAESTYTDASRYYSYRRDGETGRLFSVIQLIP